MADVNHLSFADQEGVELENVTLPTDGKQYNDVLKLSNAKNVVIKNCDISGGSEDCIDIMRYSENVLIKDCILRPKGKFCMTIKGGCRNINLENITIVGSGSEVDIDLGNFNYVTDRSSTNITLNNVKKINGDKIIVRVLNAEEPNIVNSNVKLKTYPKVIIALVMLVLKIRYKLTGK